MKQHRASVTSLQPKPPRPQLLHNLTSDVSGLLFDLDFHHDLGPYVSRHPRLKQIKEAAPLLVYADPRHCMADCLQARIRSSIERYPLLATTAWDRVEALAPYLSGAGFRKNPSGTRERHRLVVFSSAAPMRPVGFLWLGREIEGELSAHHLNLLFTLESAFVCAEYRGLGYGTALAVAAAMCCSWEVRYQVERYTSVPRGHFAIALAPQVLDPDPACPGLTTTLTAKLGARIAEDRAVLLRGGVRVLDLETEWAGGSVQ